MALSVSEFVLFCALHGCSPLRTDSCNQKLFPAPGPKATKPMDLQKAAAGAFAAFTLATSALNVPEASASDFAFSSSQVVAETVTRQGVYKEYDVEVEDQTYDDARSTFKSAKETKSKKGRFVIYTYNAMMFLSTT